MNVSNSLINEMYGLIVEGSINDLKDQRDITVDRMNEKKEVRAAMAQSKAARQAMENAEGRTNDADFQDAIGQAKGLEGTLQEGTFKNSDVAKAAEIDNVGNKAAQDKNGDGTKDWFHMDGEGVKEEWGTYFDNVDDALKSKMEELNDLSQIEQMDINAAMKRHDRATTAMSNAKSAGDKASDGIARNISS